MIGGLVLFGWREGHCALPRPSPRCVAPAIEGCALAGICGAAGDAEALTVCV